jgi:predicted DNA binding CopG/RHH family protein
MIDDKYLDEEEKDLIEALDDIDITTLPKPTKDRQKMFKDAAREFRKKETKMNIRIDEFELEKIKEFADSEGLRYQTFVKSVLHKYITGRLIEKRETG